VTDREKPKPWVTILAPPNPYSKTGGRTMVLGFREYRSKWTTLLCFCKRARRDGSCKTLDQLVPLLAHPERVKFSHERRAS
jgi:hypothetical protein